jgi:trans-2-enoyl-CoA reductase
MIRETITMIRETITERVCLELEKDDILIELSNLIPSGARNVEITVRVPGGGDWSNQTLDISEDSKLTIKYETESSNVD